MAIGKAEGIGTSYNGDQTFLFQLSLKIIDENQRGMLSDLRKQNLSTKAILFCQILDSAQIQLFFFIFWKYI